MDSVGLIKTLRYLFANDSNIRTYLGVANQAAALIRMVYQDGILVQRVNFQQYPVITFKIDDDDEGVLRGSDTNTVYVTMFVINYINNTVGSYPWNIVLHRIKDRMKILIKDNHETINSQGSTLGLNLKVRDAHWVGGVTYSDKTQGAEDLHKIICTTKFIVGD